MADWLESEFGAGLMVGVGGTGILTVLTTDMHHPWLFVAVSVVAMVAGTGMHCLLNLDAIEAWARRILRLVK